MTRNIGETERILRVIVGLIIIAWRLSCPQNNWALLGPGAGPGY